MNDTDLNKEKMIALFDKVGRDYRCRNVIESAELYVRHDVHAFYDFGDGVVHVHGMPGMSDEANLAFYVRVLDKQRMKDVRGRNVPVGDEHEAVIQEHSHQIRTPYDVRALEMKLRQAVPDKFPPVHGTHL